VLATIFLPAVPGSIAIDPATNRLFIVGTNVLMGPPLTSTTSLFIIDTTSDAVIATIPLTIPWYVPQRVAVDPTTQHVFVMPWEFDETGKKISTGTFFLAPPYGGLTAVAIDPALHRLYYLSQQAKNVTVFDTTNFRLLATANVGQSAMGLAVDSLTHVVYVANRLDASVTVINGTTDKVSATIPIGGAPTAITIDPTAGLVYVNDLVDVYAGAQVTQVGTVVVLNATDNTVLHDINSVPAGNTIAIDPVTHVAWLAGGGLFELDPVVARRAGTDRFGTATAISDAAYDPQAADAVVLARSDTYPDALVGAPFAASKNAPLLYTSGASLPAETSAEITRVLAPGKTVYLLGGTSAIPASVATQLTGMGYLVTRLSGSDRYATAVAVADAMGDPSVVFLATAGNYADALAAGPAAANTKGAILLTEGTTLPPETSAYLQAHPGTTYAIGGPAAAADPSASAISGSDRYATAALVAQQFFASPTTVGLASGTTFADALPAAAYLARVGGPLLLTDPNTLPTSAATYLVAAQSGVTSAFVFGGTSAVSTAAQTEFSTALGR
jgi:YVTN family beta-propeller protein